MNDRNKGGMTISALLTGGLIASLLIPIACLIAFGFIVANGVSPFVPAAILSVVVFAGAMLTNYLVRRRIQERLLSLVDVCRTYGGGDRSVRAVVNGDDEFAMLATSLNNLLDNQTFSSSSGSSAAPGLSDAAALQAQIEKLLQEVSAVGDGDLRVQAEVTPDTLGVLADSFNYMIEELAKVVGRVQNTAVQVTNASRRVLDRSAELAQASETQVARISQTTEAVEALADFVQDVAHNARLSAEAAQEALQNAKTGQGAVRQTIEGMMLIRENVQETSKKIKRLGERSNEIGEIVRLIEDIADQTNLLALNAAIQSAMAGEHGRGFAVVADEIRLLAEKSTESTKKIATLVKSIQGDTLEAVMAMEDSTQEVVKGSSLADEAGRALNSIYAAVERQANTIQMIAQAANEQASVSEEVANAMSEISEITNRTNAGTQEAAMSVSYLSELSDQLRASVSTFRLPERTGESTEAFDNLASLPEPGANGGQSYQQVPGANGEWGDQDFSADFLSLPQPQDNELNASGFQFTFNGQQDFSGQADFAGMPPLPAMQGGFENQPFGDFSPDFAPQANLGASQPGFGSGFGELNFGELNFGEQQGFDNQQFGGIPESGYNQPNQAPFPGSRQMPAISPQNFPSLPGNQSAGRPSQNFPPQGPGRPPQNFPSLPGNQSAGHMPQNFPSLPGNQGMGHAPQNFPPSLPESQGAGRPRWRNPQQGSGPFSSEQQMPFPGRGSNGNGHVGS